MLAERGLSTHDSRHTEPASQMMAVTATSHKQNWHQPVFMEINQKTQYKPQQILFSINI